MIIKRIGILVAVGFVLAGIAILGIEIFNPDYINNTYFKNNILDGVLSLVISLTAAASVRSLTHRH